ncbi:MAG TPA: electron transfer flavoprotein subunit alpha/FixB family protein [Tepidiformaceae bacterium]|nr:electron transfer flavoprotein subunit alpha/FixB family protein [Tepidiformaceae bacterium]
MAGILVIAEVTEGEIAPISFELIGAAKQLSAQGGGDVTAFVAGNEAQAQALIAGGADKAFAATNPNLQSGLADAYLPAVNAAIQQSGANIVLIGQTSLGRDLGPALAFANKTAVAMDSVELKMDGGRLHATRSAYGGNARAEVTWKNDLQVATVKAKSFDAPEGVSGSGSVTTISEGGESKVKVLGVEKAETTGIRLEDAGIVVSGGRGLGDPSAFGMLEQLAGTMKQAAVGASRAACDLGWYPPASQVGLTGKTVSPNLYIAVAISGASQHMAGMAGSKNIVAINKDADANMVKVSKFAVIDDYKKVIPALIEEIKKLG